MKNLVYGVACMMALLLTSCGSGEPAASASAPPQEAARPSPFDTFDIGRLDSELARPVSDGRLVNIAYRLSKDGKLAKSGFHGTRTLGGSDPVTEDTLYRLYSMSKPVTAVAVLILYEEGKIDLDAPVSQYLPELGSLKVLTGMDVDGNPRLEPARRAPTVRELLSHTAGFGYGYTGTGYVNQQFQAANVESAHDFSGLLEKVAGIPLVYQPGEGWVYSIASDLQGALVERVSGVPFDQFLETRIFQPLGMDSTGFALAEEDLGRLSDFTRPGDQPGQLTLIETPGQRSVAAQNTYPSGGAGLISSLRDYERFTRMLSGRGTLDGVTLLQPETIDLMFSDAAGKAGAADTGRPHTLKKGLGYGFGIGTITEPTLRRNGAPVSTVYWSGAAGTWFWIDPVNDITFIAMIQSLPPKGDLQVLSRDIVYHALRPEPAEQR